MRLINKIVIHNSATPKDRELDKQIHSFNITHKQRLHPKVNWYWNHIAYHYVIWGNWELEKTRPLSEAWYHAWNRDINNESIGICLCWDFNIDIPNPEQYKTFVELIKELQWGFEDLTIHLHNEFKKTSCPWKHFDFNLVCNMLSKPEIDKKTLENFKILMKANSYIWDKVEDDKLRNLLHDTNIYVNEKYL